MAILGGHFGPGTGEPREEPARVTEAGRSLDSAYEELWRQLPSSNIYKQEKLLGWSGSEDGRADGGWVAGPAGGDLGPPPAERDFHAVALGAYHLVLQWYLQDLESLIGCCIVDSRGGSEGSGRPARLLASYVYAEDEDPLDSFLDDVGEQLRSDRCLEVEPGRLAYRGSKPAAPFFYLGGNGGLGLGGWSPEVIEAGLPGRGVVLCATDGRAAAWMRSSVAEVIDPGGFQKRYDEALAAILTGKHPSVGEVRRGLGEAPKVPSKQLDEMQRRVLALWAKVLDLDPETLHETSSYFDLGGTSLNAFKLVNRVRLELHRDISIRDIVENPTVRDFARLLS